MRSAPLALAALLALTLASGCVVAGAGSGAGAGAGLFGSGASPSANASPGLQAPTQQPENNAPIIDSLDANPGFLVDPGASVTFTVNARDPLGDSIVYSWTSSGGFLTSNVGQTVKWNAINTDGTPLSSGPYQIVLTLKNRRGLSTSQTVNVIVKAKAAAAAAVTTTATVTASAAPAKQ